MTEYPRYFDLTEGDCAEFNSSGNLTLRCASDAKFFLNDEDQRILLRVLAAKYADGVSPQRAGFQPATQAEEPELPRAGEVTSGVQFSRAKPIVLACTEDLLEFSKYDGGISILEVRRGSENRAALNEHVMSDGAARHLRDLLLVYYPLTAAEFRHHAGRAQRDRDLGPIVTGVTAEEPTPVHLDSTWDGVIDCRDEDPRVEEVRRLVTVQPSDMPAVECGVLPGLKVRKPPELTSGHFLSGTVSSSFEAIGALLLRVDGCRIGIWFSCEDDQRWILARLVEHVECKTFGDANAEAGALGDMQEPKSISRYGALVYLTDFAGDSCSLDVKEQRELVALLRGKFCPPAKVEVLPDNSPGYGHLVAALENFKTAVLDAIRRGEK